MNVYAMTDVGSIVICYTLVLGGMAAFAWRVVARGKALAKRLPDEDKPWA